MSDTIVNPEALEPLFGPSDIPTHHRVRGDKPGNPAKVISSDVCRPPLVEIVLPTRKAPAVQTAEHFQ